MAVEIYYRMDLWLSTILTEKILILIVPLSILCRLDFYSLQSVEA